MPCRMITHYFPVIVPAIIDNDTTVWIASWAGAIWPFIHQSDEYNQAKSCIRKMSFRYD